MAIITAKLSRFFEFIWNKKANPAVEGDRLTQSLNTALNNLNFAIQERHGVGTLANRPLPGASGRFYYATDQNVLYEDVNGNWVAVGNGSTVILLSPMTFASLPASPGQGTVACIKDSTVNTWGAAVTIGGGVLPVLVWYTGSNWSVFATA